MKHLTCDLCGKPAPHTDDRDAHAVNYLCFSTPRRFRQYDLCDLCADEIYAVTEAKCAELKAKAE